MLCKFETVNQREDGKWKQHCSRCKRSWFTAEKESSRLRRTCSIGGGNLKPDLSDKEKAELFPGESDPTLIGNRIAALTAALGIPPCGGCNQRKGWLNRAHQWLRDQFKESA